MKAYCFGIVWASFLVTTLADAQTAYDQQTHRTAAAIFHGITCYSSETSKTNPVNVGKHFAERAISVVKTMPKFSDSKNFEIQSRDTCGAAKLISAIHEVKDRDKMEFAFVHIEPHYFEAGSAKYVDKFLDEQELLHIVFDGNIEDRVMRAIDIALGEWSNVEKKTDWKNFEEKQKALADAFWDRMAN